MKTWRRALALILMMLGLEAGTAQEPQPSEYQLKAAFLYHFAQFTEWPADAFASQNSPLVVGVLGENPFGPLLEQTLKGKTLERHPVVLKTLRSPDEATNNCHILFVSSSEKKRFSELFSTLRNSSVLTVGETDGFLDFGGVINFVRQGNKIRFQINDTNAKTAGLRIRSKLLSLAITNPGS